VADAVVIGLAKKAKGGQKSSADEGDDSAEDAGMSLDEAEDDAVNEMAEVLNIDDEDRGKFKDALKDFVAACVKREQKGEY
jgi:hypothetical protein